jgi:hypothetical protein
MRNRTELIMILATAVVLVLFIVYDKFSTEGFEDSNSPIPAVTTCPNFADLNTSAYYDKKDVMCCKGEVKNNKCSSVPYCTLGKATIDIKTCSDVLAQEFKGISTSFCPSKLPNFYYNSETGEAGCTDSPLKPNYKGPVRTNANKCNAYFKIKDDGNEKRIDYEYMNLGLTNPDGCLGQKKLEDLQKQCIGQDCVPFVRKVPSQNTALYGLDFTDVDNIRRTCYEDSSYNDYIMKLNRDARVLQSPYKEQACSNAKTLYIDKGKL